MKKKGQDVRKKAIIRCEECGRMLSWMVWWGINDKGGVDFDLDSVMKINSRCRLCSFDGGFLEALVDLLKDIGLFFARVHNMARK